VAHVEVSTAQGVHSIPIEPDTICSIGRGSQNTIVLDDASVSRRHAMIDCQPHGDCYIIDVGSRNGTFLNGSRVTTRTRLSNGDSLRIGTVPVTFWLAGSGVDTHPSVNLSNTQLITVTAYVTVLVMDIRDFTGLSRRLGETRLSGFIGEFMRLSGEVLDGYGASTQKYIGDAIMGVWDHGPQRPEPDAILSVLSSAAKVYGIVSETPRAFDVDTPIRIGAGINTGVAVMGNLGSAAAADYTALGDAVNKAFRLETASKEISEDMLMGSFTYKCLGSGLQPWFTPHTVSLKGYEKPETAYAISVASLTMALSSGH
jgi:adenylate cyclase